MSQPEGHTARCDFCTKSTVRSPGSSTQDSQESNLTPLSSLNVNDRTLLLLRSQAKDLPPHPSVCLKHLNHFLVNFEYSQKKCCDPFGKHKKIIRGTLHSVGIPLAEKLNDLDSVLKVVVPGEKVCVSCKITITEIGLSFHEAEPEPMGGSSEELLDSQDLFTSPEDAGQLSGSSIEDPDIVILKINEFLSLLKIENVELRRWSDGNKVNLIKSKCEEVHSALIEKFTQALDVDVSSIKETNTHDCPFDSVFAELQEKIGGFDKLSKLQTLTLAPRSWGRDKIAQFFNVSSALARKGLELRQDHGIMAIAQAKKRIGIKLSEETQTLVVKYYYSEENSRVLPGMKDKVSIVRGKQQAQKRLILCNLSELFALFKRDYPNKNIGFSKFCSLRPKECVLAGGSGTHVVCVCVYHQNVDLLLDGLGMKMSSSHLIQSLVCSPPSQACMMRICPNCLPFPAFAEKLKFLMMKERSASVQDEPSTSSSHSDGDEDSDVPPEADLDEDEVIKYHQWVSTDRCELVTQETSVAEALQTLSVKLNSLIPHAYVAKVQGDFYKSQKDNLDDDSALIILDFSQNYMFKVQNEAQSHHWNKNACTIHPVLMYIKVNGKIESHSLCFLSEDLTHDVAMVVTIIDKTVNYLKEKFPFVKKISYFSDGCAAQYKNCNNLLNLCLHYTKYGIKATWSFFCTSHGKTACDGIGGTIKREAARASLQRDRGEPINNVLTLWKFCKEHVKGIDVFVIDKNEIASVRESRKGVKAITIPGTRSLHHFVPLSDCTIGCKTTSEDTSFTVVHDLQLKEIPLAQWKPDTYVAVKLTIGWYVGLITDINDEEKEADVILLTPPGSNSFYKWREDEVLTMTVPYPSLVCEMELTERGDKLYPKNIRQVSSLVRKHTVG